MSALLTIDQVAEQLHKSRRWLQDFLRDHPDCYLRIGRTPQFEDAHIARLIARIDQSCRSSSSRRVKANRPIGRYAAPTSESELTEALRLASELSRSRRSAKSKARSNVVSLPRRAS